MTNEITQELLRELFDYRDGNLYWKVSKALHLKVDDLAGHVNKNGYLQIGINYKSYYAHRLIFLYHHGYLPKYLDHIDRDVSNNAIDNLREATQQQNHFNMKKNKSCNGKPTSSKFKGVSWDKQLGKWRSYITIDGKKKHLGVYNYEIAAAKAYNREAIRVRGDFANPNFDDRKLYKVMS